MAYTCSSPSCIFPECIYAEGKKIPLAIARGMLCYLFIVVVFGHIELLPRYRTHQTALTPDAALGLAANVLGHHRRLKTVCEALIIDAQPCIMQDKGILPAASGLAISRQGRM